MNGALASDDPFFHISSLVVTYAKKAVIDQVWGDTIMMSSRRVSSYPRVSRRKIKSTKVGKNHRISADECREFMQDKFALEVFKV